MFLKIFELGIHYSFSSDHNVVNASLELLQQLLKMRTLVLAIPILKSANGLQGTRISLRGLTKANSKYINSKPILLVVVNQLLFLIIYLFPLFKVNGTWLHYQLPKSRFCWK